jgi:hypothetical protein
MVNIRPDKITIRNSNFMLQNSRTIGSYKETQLMFTCSSDLQIHCQMKMHEVSCNEQKQHFFTLRGT